MMVPLALLVLAAFFAAVAPRVLTAFVLAGPGARPRPCGHGSASWQGYCCAAFWPWPCARPPAGRPSARTSSPVRRTGFRPPTAWGPTGPLRRTRRRAGLRRSLDGRDAAAGDPRRPAAPAHRARGPAHPFSAAAGRGARRRAARRAGRRPCRRLVAAGHHTATGHHHGRTAPAEGASAGRRAGPRTRARPGEARLALALFRAHWPAASPVSRSSPGSAIRCTGWWNWRPTTPPPGASAA